MRTRILFSFALLAGCSEDPAPATSDAPPPETTPRCARSNPMRDLYWGDLHVHTGFSFDAWLNDVRADPNAAYRFAKGEPLAVPPLDEQGQGTRVLSLGRPLDFVAVTDHAEFLAEVLACTTPTSAVYDEPFCENYRLAEPSALTLFGLQLQAPMPMRFAEVCGPGKVDCQAGILDAWRRIQQAAEDHYDRSDACTFTTFVGYEWTGVKRVSNLHRNVIFRSERVPDIPISYYEEPTPQGLWKRLDEDCRRGLFGCDALVIPHNANWSNGKMFVVEDPPGATPEELAESARLRAELEPLYEIFQHKGDSECQDGVSGILGAPDELCAFEKLRKPGFNDCGDGVGDNGIVGLGCVSRLDFARGILLEGLAEEARLGVNPYPMGLVASTDTHNGTPGYVAEAAYAGHTGSLEEDAFGRLTGDVPAGPRNNPGGLVAVWAVENSRDAIFDALQRKETYGTSGPRIAVRLFGGADIPTDACERPDWVEIGYRDGVPMGGRLSGDKAASSPTFVLSALADPGSATEPSTPLARAQIIKGWVDDAGAHVEVIDVAGGEPQGGVDASCQPTGTGPTSLCGVWTDPNFDPNARAFYYARVVENPVCRWSNYDCRSGVQPRPLACDDPTLAETISERAWTSPIFYSPP